LTESLLCPEPHGSESHCVIVPEETVGRDVRRGVVGCPTCEREYPVVDGVVTFGPDPWGAGLPEPGDASASPDADTLHALLGLTTPGGYVVLLGSAARFAESLAQRLSGVHLVGVNAPPGIGAGSRLSLLRSPARLPLRTGMARGVVVGEEHCTDSWLKESARVLLRKLRLIALTEKAAIPGVQRLVSRSDLWVGERE
ncbi:MAG: hypothetical protein ACE5PT_12420, partial [Gemmatimonadales bacterium]